MPFLDVSIQPPSVLLFAIGIVIVGGAFLSGFIAFTGGQSSGLHEEFHPGERAGRRPKRG